MQMYVLQSVSPHVGPGQFGQTRSPIEIVCSGELWRIGIFSHSFRVTSLVVRKWNFPVCKIIRDCIVIIKATIDSNAPG